MNDRIQAQVLGPSLNIDPEDGAAFILACTEIPGVLAIFHLYSETDSNLYLVVAELTDRVYENVVVLEERVTERLGSSPHVLHVCACQGRDPAFAAPAGAKLIWLQHRNTGAV